MRIRHRPLAAAIFVAALFFLLQAAWVPAKAAVGQWLLERAWAAHQAGAADARPWPWADTQPVAVLEIPRLGLRQLVLEGASGRNLAWGPAAVTPVHKPDVILSGHRDTHFAPLAELRAGDTLRLHDGSRQRKYTVAWLDIVDSRYQELVTRDDRDRLTLVTCYPFDAPSAGGPLRLVVTALPASDDAVAVARSSQGFAPPVEGPEGR